MQTTLGFFVIVFAIAMVVLGPIAAIWALNTLFGLSIATTFDTWVAALIIMSILRGDGLSFSKK